MSTEEDSALPILPAAPQLLALRLSPEPGLCSFPMRALERCVCVAAGLTSLALIAPNAADASGMRRVLAQLQQLRKLAWTIAAIDHQDGYVAALAAVRPAVQLRALELDFTPHGVPAGVCGRGRRNPRRAV